MVRGQGPADRPGMDHLPVNTRSQPVLESGDVLESADCQREIEFGEEGLQVVGQALGAAVG